MIVTTLNGLGAFAGAWEDWCDQNYYTPANNAKCRNCNKKKFPLVGERCTYFDPKTTAGRLERGLPLKTDLEMGAPRPNANPETNQSSGGGIRITIPTVPGTTPAGGTSIPGDGSGMPTGWLLGGAAALGMGLLFLRKRKKSRR